MTPALARNLRGNYYLVLLLGLAMVVFIGTACGAGNQSPTIPPSLPLEKLVIEPGEPLRIRIPPDQSARPDEAQPQAFIEFVITDASGQPVRANVAVDGQTTHRDVAQFLLVLPHPSKPTTLKISALGYEEWEVGLRFNLKHTRRFQVPIVMHPNPD